MLGGMVQSPYEQLPEEVLPSDERYKWTEVSASFSVTDWGDWSPEMIALLIREVERGGGRVVSE